GMQSAAVRAQIGADALTASLRAERGDVPAPKESMDAAACAVWGEIGSPDFGFMDSNSSVEWSWSRALAIGMRRSLDARFDDPFLELQDQDTIRIPARHRVLERSQIFSVGTRQLECVRSFSQHRSHRQVAVFVYAPSVQPDDREAGKCRDRIPQAERARLRPAPGGLSLGIARSALGVACRGAGFPAGDRPEPGV